MGAGVGIVGVLRVNWQQRDATCLLNLFSVELGVIGNECSILNNTYV